MVSGGLEIIDIVAFLSPSCCRLLPLFVHSKQRIGPVFCPISNQDSFSSQCDLNVSLLHHAIGHCQQNKHSNLFELSLQRFKNKLLIGPCSANMNIFTQIFGVAKWKCVLWLICLFSLFSHPSSLSAVPSLIIKRANTWHRGEEVGLQGSQLVPWMRTWHKTKKERRKEEIEKELKIGDGQMEGKMK